MRVVSLLPSATEIVLALGAGDSLVGVSHSCDDPGVVHLPRLTRTRVPKGATSGEIDTVVRDCLGKRESLYMIDIDALARLEPDLIITQGLCEVCAVSGREVRGALGGIQAASRVLSSEPQTLAQVLESIVEIGSALGKDTEAAALVAGLQRRVDAVCARTALRSHHPRVAFLEWLDPPMCGGHWNPELVDNGRWGGRYRDGRCRESHHPVGRRPGVAARGVVRRVLRLSRGADPPRGGPVAPPAGPGLAPVYTGWTSACLRWRGAIRAAGTGNSGQPGAAVARSRSLSPGQRASR